MPAAYDKYDYVKYWVGREYENKAEVIAIKSFLSKIKKIHTIFEIGAGFGRLAPSYMFRAKKVILSDPSSKTLKLARKTFSRTKNIKFIHTSVENIPSKVRAGSVDVVVMVRVLHHIKDVDSAFKIINRVLSKGGYLVLEFANKRHFKASFENLLKGNFGFFSNENPTDIRSAKSLRQGALPFMNYDPNRIRQMLSNEGFQIIDQRSVSNIRSPFLKSIFSTDVLVSLDALLQKPLSYIDFGPSIFVLARKRA